MAVIGGIIGALAKYYTSQKKHSLKNSIIRGILLGFMGSVVYYVLGYSLITLEVSDIFNEFAILGFSALVAFLGLNVSSQSAPA